MEYYLICGGIFLTAYAVNLIYVSVFYHRGLTHGAVELKKPFRSFITASGPWVMGIDAKTWCTMHRLHHDHSDKAEDPHSPLNSSILRVLVEQLKSYETIMRGLIARKKKYTHVTPDLDFPVHWIYRKKMWWAPYAVHIAAAIGIAYGMHGALAGFAFFTGISTHPFQGWLVNAFGHSSGYQTFDNKDNSKNNNVVSWLVIGEGYQNNHHMYPRSAKFSYRWFEFDYGYIVCLFLEKARLLKVDRANLIETLEEGKELEAA